MIAATELRIGNNFQDEEGQVLTCFGVACEMFENQNKGIVWYDLEGGFFLEEDEIEPIPLTEDWLLKFGFENVGYFNFWGTRYFYKGICIYLIGNEFRFYYQTNRAYTIYDSVHEIQNLCFALGKELTIKE